ncbi:putative transcriptional regulator with C-terminal CBS domains [Belliella baltica DSM 15883]|uniref:Putative transcriptional regulator with C-terminal CBS domains n=1 Tax=Belliella baltica (strain DSM 15883 / CIP 108006 / LMG 21964 / BA134) TaxID=866536 RepID=I3Z231_BELBD|nr:helix-turn-helix transcriptional regulator [Belliella baltica]AFL83299.1 putative transcriptional regulator with C-terminal CBS domains [Belliella baltica DSM 15883]
MKSYKLEEAEDLLIGKIGTQERDEYEFELKLELIGDMIKIARKKRKLTQEQLGELVGVKKAQISRLENSTGNVTFETVVRIFNALGAKMNVNLQM